jgi:hypothetical protein
MTGFLFGAILLLTVACWVMLGDEDWRPFAIAFLAAAPFLLFSTIAIYTFVTTPAGEYRVALEGFELDLAANGEPVTVGGGADGEEADDLIVRDLPPRFLMFRVEGDSLVAALPGELDRTGENPTHAVVRVDDERPFANSVAVKNGETFPLIPARRQKITERWSIPILRNLNAQTAMYPLRFWSRPKGSDEVVTGTDGSPLGSFLSFDGGFFRNTLFVTFTGDGTKAAGKQYNPRVAVIEQGTPRSFALFRLDYADPKLGDDSRSLAQERRSFTASYEKGRLSLVFDTPDVVRLAPTVVERLVKDGSFLLATRDPRRDAPVISNQMVLSFPQLGPRVQNELFSAIRVSESGDCRVRVTSHTGTRCYASGEAFRVGDRAAAIVRVTEIGTPWGIIATLFVLAFLSFLWMRRTVPRGSSESLGSSGTPTPQLSPRNSEEPRGTPRNPVIAIILVSAAEVLLAVRLLIAFEGALLDPASASGLWESLVIFALLPFTLRVAYERVFTRAMWVEGAAIVALVAITLVRANVGTKWVVVVCAAVLLVPLIASWLANLVIDRVSAIRVSFRWIVVLAVIVAVVRMAMVFGLGWKERVSLPGVDLALTILYLPVVFLFFAFLWQHIRDLDGAARLTGKQIGAGVLAAALGVLLTIVIPWFVKDSGSALVHVPAIVLLFALPVLVRANRVTIPLAVPLACVVALHLVVGLMPHLRGQEKNDPAYQKALSDPAEANDFMARRLGQSTNQLRILSYVAPHQLEQAGTSKAEGLVMQRRMLDRYSGTGVFGAGWLHVPLTMFRDTHMNDNLSAIHILAPFGIAGALGVVALMVALALLPLRSRFTSDETPERAIDQRTALGILALWTFSLCGIYMFAANVGMVLFTGKNVYLLAATSNSDAIEGGVLLLIALVALGRVSEVQSLRVAEGVAITPPETVA